MHNFTLAGSNSSVCDESHRLVLDRSGYSFLLLVEQ